MDYRLAICHQQEIGQVIKYGTAPAPCLHSREEQRFISRAPRLHVSQALTGQYGPNTSYPGALLKLFRE